MSPQIKGPEVHTWNVLPMARAAADAHSQEKGSLEPVEQAHHSAKQVSATKLLRRESALGTWWCWRL